MGENGVVVHIVVVEELELDGLGVDEAHD
jgi:hypothetical protein